MYERSGGGTNSPQIFFLLRKNILSTDLKRKIEVVCVFWEPGSSVGIATDYRLEGPVRTSFSARPEQPWGSPSLL